MQTQRANLMTAIWANDIRTLIRLTDAWPQLLSELNAKGQTPQREYLDGGGRVRGIIANTTPPFVIDDWNAPTWYGAPGAWTKAAW